MGVYDLPRPQRRLRDVPHERVEIVHVPILVLPWRRRGYSRLAHDDVIHGGLNMGASWRAIAMDTLDATWGKLE